MKNIKAKESKQKNMLNKSQYKFLKEFNKATKRTANNRLSLNKLEKLVSKYDDLIPGNKFDNNNPEDKLEGRMLEALIFARLDDSGMKGFVIAPFDDGSYSLTPKALEEIEKYKHSKESSIISPRLSNALSIISIIISVIALILEINK